MVCGTNQVVRVTNYMVWRWRPNLNAVAGPIGGGYGDAGGGLPDPDELAGPAGRAAGLRPAGAAGRAGSALTAALARYGHRPGRGHGHRAAAAARWHRDRRAPGRPAGRRRHPFS